MCARRKLAAFCLVLLVASSYVWAFPGRKEAKALSVQEEPSAAIEKTSTVKEAKPEQNEQRSDLRKLEESLERKEIPSIAEETAQDSELQELYRLLEEQVADQREAEADIQRLLAENEELRKANASQADSIAYTKGQLDKATSLKTFANVKAVIGFEDMLPRWGVGGEIGLKLSSGLMLSTGASYMIGDFSSPASLGWDLDSLSLSLGLGWEW